MKKNFLVTTGLVDTWEFSENNFLLGAWCEFCDLSKKGLSKESEKKISIFKNIHHWEDSKKKNEDYEYLKNNFEKILDILSEKLSIIHQVKENKEYWRVIISNWLNQYIVILFDRWECIRLFFEKNKEDNFYSNFISLKDKDYIPEDHANFVENYHKDTWNHLIFIRLFNFLKIKNLSLIEKNIKATNLDEEIFLKKYSPSLSTMIVRLVDKLISRYAFKFNKIILESFYFPKKEYLKICLRCNLIPTKYTNFFDIKITKDISLANDKRKKLKNLLSKLKTQDRFIQFVLMNLHQDIPKSYLESFDTIKKKIQPLAKMKKTIFSMHSMVGNDNFKVYIAETKKVGSKFIFSMHGGGLKNNKDPRFKFFEKISDKIIRWDNTEEKLNVYDNLSPTLPVVKLKNTNKGDNCSILFCEFPRYVYKFISEPRLDQTITLFNELTQFVNELDPAIKSKIKFRAKRIGNYASYTFNSEKKFSEIFGEKRIDKPSYDNPFEKTLFNSRLVISTYPETAFSEAMHFNVPTILVIKEKHWQLAQKSLDIFNILKANQIAFEDFSEAKTHINKSWKEIDLWWKRENVQFARREFLKNFFNVKSNWFEEWSDYIYSSKEI